MSFLKKYKPHLVLVLLLVFIISSWTVFPTLSRVTYSRNSYKADSLAENAALTIDVVSPKKTATTTAATLGSVMEGASSTLQVVHIPTPTPMRAIYMTSWVAGTASIREKLLTIIDTTEINAVVIDIKDYTGKISFITHDPELLASGVGEKRISDIDALIDRLHKKGVYVIGRVAVFQDPFMVSKHPEIAVKRQSDGGVWKDRKGISWIDASSEVQWNHIAKIARESYARGFDEINFDYVRYPSDGNMKDIAFPVSGDTAKHIAIKNFLSNMQDQLKPEGIVLSADFFGLTTVAVDDLGIGQKLEDALLTMDYVYPMVYPSHFANGWNGFAKGNERVFAQAILGRKLFTNLLLGRVRAHYLPEAAKEVAYRWKMEGADRKSVV